LDALNARRARLLSLWRSLIKEVRSVYSGPISYAANFDEYQDIGFWSELDIMGVNAYFKLREELPEFRSEAKREEALKAALEKGWQGVFSKIKDFQTTKSVGKKPVLFTELGYTFKRESTLTPWAASGVQFYGEGEERKAYLNGKGGPDYAERAMAIQALREITSASDIEFKGLLYWKLSSIASHESIEPFVHILGSVPDQEMGKALRAFPGSEVF